MMLDFQRQVGEFEFLGTLALALLRPKDRFDQFLAVLISLLIAAGGENLLLNFPVFLDSPIALAESLFQQNLNHAVAGAFGLGCDFIDLGDYIGGKNVGLSDCRLSAHVTIITLK
jgi:hypothetical protein